MLPNFFISKEIWNANPTPFIPDHARYFISSRYILG